MKGRSEPKKEKIEAVENLSELIKKYPVIGILNLYKTPASALQKIKKELKNKAVIKVARKSIVLRALEKSGKGNLKEFMTDYPALMLGNLDPFRLYLFLQKRRLLLQLNLEILHQKI